ncbi:hypothetical protein [Cohnella sp.]|uniref:hypothetical protein n=1 Tax=Cohnella sp. TaxID=1883426 RepID=UPI0035680F31
MGGYSFIEVKDMRNYSIDQLKEIDGIGLLTPQSKVKFQKWCRDLQIVKQNKYLHPLIIEYQNEVAYRKTRDEEHKFRDALEPYMLRNSKVENRRNKAILSMYISEKQANRSYRIINCLINAVGELGGTIYVSSGEQDNTRMRFLDHEFSISLTEIMVKLRSLLSNQQSDNMNISIRPMYEKVPSGLLTIEFKEILGYADRNKSAKSLCFVETLDRPLEKQMGEIINDLLKIALDIDVASHIADREYEIKQKEQERLYEIEEAKKQAIKKLEEYNIRKQHLTQNIENQMENWFKAQKLRDYAEELESFVSTASDETTKKLLNTYINFVRQKANKCDPVKNILNDVKDLESEFSG